MSEKDIECLGRTVSVEACFGPDAEVTRQLGEAACMTCVVSAFRKLADDNNKLRNHAERDGLTDLLNRRMFDVTLENRVSENEPFGVVFIDLRSFGEVNSRELHVGGDAVLKHTAKYLEDYFSNTLRRDDVIARIGGDEFGVILNPSREGNTLVEEQILVIKERLEDKFLQLPIVEAYNHQYGDDAPLGLHVGHALWQPGMTTNDLLAIADPKYGKRPANE